MAEDKPGKIKQQQAGYMDPDKGPFLCSHCSHFDKITGHDCEVVEGVVHPKGCCNNYEPLKGKDEGAAKAMKSYYTQKP